MAEFKIYNKTKENKPPHCPKPSCRPVKTYIFWFSK